jgi:hypothetical protein
VSRRRTPLKLCSLDEHQASRPKTGRARLRQGEAVVRPRERETPAIVSVPGIGWVLAFTIAAEIGDITRFPSPSWVEDLAVAHNTARGVWVRHSSMRRKRGLASTAPHVSPSTQAKPARTPTASTSPRARLTDRSASAGFFLSVDSQRCRIARGAGTWEGEPARPHAALGFRPSGTLSSGRLRSAGHRDRPRGI